MSDTTTVWEQARYLRAAFDDMAAELRKHPGRGAHVDALRKVLGLAMVDTGEELAAEMSKLADRLHAATIEAQG